MGNISNTLDTNQVVSMLNGLATDRATWEKGSYKTSTDELVGLLDRCFSLLQQLKGHSKLIKELNALLTEKGIVFNEGTSLGTKITRFVFNGKNNRITGYAKVLRIAAEEKSEKESVAAFIKRKGGIEEVRKQKVAGVLTKAEQAKLNIQLAEKYYVSSDALVQDIACSAPEVHPNAESEHNFSAALIRMNDDGTLSIVYGCNKASVVKMLLSEGGKIVGEQLQDNAANDDLRQAQAARAAAVAALAA